MRENPYAPPESDHPEGDPTSFWIEDGRLYVQDGGSLPEICLQTGVAGAELVRMDLPFSWIPAWAGWVIIPLMLVAWLVGSPFLTLAMLAVWILLLFRAQRVCRMGISVLESPVRWATALKYGQLVVAILIIVGVTLLDLAFEFRVILIFASLSFGRTLLKRMVRGIRLEKIENGVAVLGEVNPKALQSFREWRDDHS